MWQQLRKFPVRLNKKIQTNYFRTKNGDKMLKYNIKSDQSLCVDKYSTVCRVQYCVSLTTHHFQQIERITIQLLRNTVLYQNYAKGIVCHTPNRYHIQYTTVPKVLVHLCVRLCVYLCCPPIYSRRLSSPFGISWARQPGSHNSFFFTFLGGGTKQCTSTAVQYSSSTSALKVPLSLAGGLYCWTVYSDS